MNDFTGRKLLVLGGTSSMGKATPARSCASAASALITGRTQDSVDAGDHAVVRTPIYDEFVPKDQMDSTLDSFNAFHPHRSHRYR